VTLAPEVLSLQEDMPVMFKIELSYLHDGTEQQLTLNRTVMMRRNTALLWDDSGKLASFITPNDETVQTFALSVLSSADNGESPNAFAGLLSEKARQAALLADAVGIYGIRYVEDPASPFTEVFGRSDALDTVRFPRTTLRVRSGDCDDTASLLASLYETVGIQTAIMTSPGHVFIAFDTQEPAANQWLYTSERRSVIRHRGTLWIPVETTILEQGFPAAWEEASRLVQTHGEEVEFLPLAEQRALYPAIPLGPAGFTVVAPEAAAVHLHAERSRKELVVWLYERQGELLQAEAATLKAGTPARFSVLNRLAIVHARAGKIELAQEVFQEILAGAPDNIPAALNLANIELLQGDFPAARSRAEKVLNMRPFSVAALSISIRAALHLGDINEAQSLLENMHAIDAEAAAQISRTYPGLEAGGAQASSAAPPGSAVQAGSGERAATPVLTPQPSALQWAYED
ncbi:MAG: tetratricopeptide repeat protein, partial [Spirochaetia bacterium]